MPPPSPPHQFFQRVMVFIDGTNLLQRLGDELGVNIVPEKHEEKAILAASSLLSDGLVSGARFKVIRKYWFSSFRGDSPKKLEIAERLRSKGYEPMIFRKKGNREKGVDIALAMSMLTNAFNQNMDVAYLIAGDEDYLNLVTEIKRYGPRVFGAFLKNGLSKELKLSFDKFNLLQLGNVGKCFL